MNLSPLEIAFFGLFLIDTSTGFNYECSEFYVYLLDPRRRIVPRSRGRDLNHCEVCL